MKPPSRRLGPFFIGLFITLPILGRTTWHLYRKLVAPETEPAPPP